MAEAAVALEAGDKFRRELVLLLDTTALQHVVPSGADDGNGEKITQTQRSKDRMRQDAYFFAKQSASENSSVIWMAFPD